MPIDIPTAADIAMEYGLGLPDLRALVMLADDEREARELAARFSPKPARTTDAASRALLEEWTARPNERPKPTQPIETRSSEPERRSPNK